MSETLPSLTQAQSAEPRRPKAVAWYRSPLDSETRKRLHRKSDALAWLQTGGYLLVLAATGTLAWHSAYHWPVLATVGLVFLHGTVYAFQINAVHELIHGTVFSTRWLNGAFANLFAFLGWINHRKFEASHAQHHRYTLHPPDDLEVVLPTRVASRQFWQQAIVNFKGLYRTFEDTWRMARGRFKGTWENYLFPASNPEGQKRPIRWARLLLAGHGLIVAGSVVLELWMLPLLTTLAPFYGSWLFFLCNNTQHIGMQDNVSDFRLCCRSFKINPIVQFLYWRMNYHTEHHMYAAVPCYRLGALRRAIEDDLPPCPKGLVATWREIAAIQARQDADSSYQFQPELPTPARKG